MTHPESTPSTPTETPVDTKKTPDSVPVGPDGMTDYIRRPKAEIQGESKNFLAKLRAEVDKLIHPKQAVTSTPYAGAAVNAPNEVGVSANDGFGGLPDGAGNTPPPGVTVPEGRFDDRNMNTATSTTTHGVNANYGGAMPSAGGNTPPPGVTVPEGQLPGF